MDEHPEVGALDRLLAAGGVRSVTCITETGHPKVKGIASMTGDYPRLLLGMTGQRVVSVFRNGRSERCVLGPGDCLVMTPRTWLVTEPAEAYFTLGVALEARNPRLVLARKVRGLGATRSEGPRAEVKILPGLCDDVTMSLSAALIAAQSGPANDLYGRKLAEALWLRVVRHLSAGNAAASKANVTYSAAEHFVREHSGRAIDRAEVARFLRIHPSHVTRLFLRFAGESFGGYLLRVRLERARALLRDPRLTVSEIAYLAGFASPNYFVRAYRQRYRVTPGRDRTWGEKV